MGVPQVVAAISFSGRNLANPKSASLKINLSVFFSRRMFAGFKSR